MIKKYKKFTTNKLGKEELDLMTKEEIDDYRMNLITKSMYTDQYLNELEIYNEVRFKDKTFEMYDGWLAKSEENKKKGVKDKLLDFNVSMLRKKDGHNLLYYLGLISDLKKIKSFEHIKGINIEIPDDYRLMMQKMY